MFLREAWPAESSGQQTKVFAFLENGKGERLQILGDFSGTSEAKKILSVYGNFAVNDVVAAGCGLVYIYVDADSALASDIVDEAQISFY